MCLFRPVEVMEEGFAAGRNRKSEEERSSEGLEAREQELVHSKNLFRNEKSGGDFCSCCT
jgi:hypothetical protein